MVSTEDFNQKDDSSLSRVSFACRAPAYTERGVDFIVPIKGAPVGSLCLVSTSLGKNLD